VWEGKDAEKEEREAIRIPDIRKRVRNVYEYRPRAIASPLKKSILPYQARKARGKHKARGWTWKGGLIFQGSRQLKEYEGGK